ncbi:prophage tail fiber family protein [Escherichia coli DEC4F]|nr:prophage tail fiber family protein [Escherichia coli DEC4F]
MAVKISGVLKDGTGKPVENCTIQLKARRNSATVVVNTVASENPDEAGRYSMDVEYGQYSVILLVKGSRRHMPGPSPCMKILNRGR